MILPISSTKTKTVLTLDKKEHMFQKLLYVRGLYKFFFLFCTEQGGWGGGFRKCPAIEKY